MPDTYDGRKKAPAVKYNKQRIKRYILNNGLNGFNGLRWSVKKRIGIMRIINSFNFRK